MLYEYMKEFGYSDKNIEKIRNIHCICHYTDEGLYRKVNELYIYFSSIGYSKEEFIKVTCKCPMIFSYTANNLKQKNR